ncbi:MAG TPA: UDP-N-acetylmuramate dehydrogenase [Erysipelotrichaceae bacterium]|jgi:UDP-N-acetylmuramate dehydrogenase|nr:UDP-N-acetylmuramate dehydrogenase [Erysipelotrichia bacterium]HPX32901.1 UDP-N-acetylmuramate dehydrogenase [Erysipelotrichaceae bacterium]HQA85408.1 UDP-N-acetylmuramate dehydrogenase [Erysipelotrichaceae bacterium]
MDKILNKLEQYCTIEYDKSFKTLTTFKIGGLAKYVIYPNDEFSLKSILDIFNENNLAYKVFGYGSNILCGDDVYDGFIIKLTRNMSNYYFADNQLIAQAGCSIISLAYKASEKSLSGLEFATGIPGTLGGCIYMNAGAYNSSMSDIVDSVKVIRNDGIVWLSNAQCQFGYRSSVFLHNPDWIILEVKLILKEGNIIDIKNLMKNRQKRRLETQPLNYPSAGSTFRNIGDIYAWKLIDEIGYRGKKIGGAMVSEKHTNFIINKGNAKASDVIELSNQIIEKIKEKHGIEMIMEVEKFNWEK